jgi:hypothetical protein
MARLLAEGKSLVLSKGFKEEKILISYLKQARKDYDIIVLGSSRAMPVGSASFPGKTFHNLSISGASVQNLAAIYELMKSNGIRSKTIIVSPDPWLVVGYPEARHADLDLLFYKSRNEKRYYRTILKRYYDLLTEIMSFSYFQSSINAGFSKQEKEGRTFHVAGKNSSDEMNSIMSDGSREWMKKYNERSVAETRDAAVKYINKDMKVFVISPFNSAMQREFELLIRSLKKSGAAIVFWFPPYHPLVYARMKTECPIVIQSQKYFTGIARENNIPTYGSYNPDEYGFGENDLFDHHHLKNIPAKLHMIKMARALGL